MIEVLDSPTAGRSAAVQMMREACILEGLRHAGTPRVYECGVLPDRRPWVAVELVTGTTLTEELQRGPLGVDEVIELLECVAEILAHAHKRGVLHRDVVPDAIVRGGTERGFPLSLSGWRSARPLDTELAPSLPGANHYRAPELSRGDEIDGRADVFALGMIAYEALTGEIASLPLEWCAPGPAELAMLIDRMLSEDRFRRPSASEVCAAARAIREDLAEGAVTPEVVVQLSDVSRAKRRTKPRWTPQIDFADPLAEPDEPLTIRQRSGRDRG
jgi:serine/threonine protein kinase